MREKMMRPNETLPACEAHKCKMYALVELANGAETRRYCYKHLAVWIEQTANVQVTIFDC